MVYFFTYVSSCLEQIRKKNLNIDIKFKIEFKKNASFLMEIEMSDLKWMRKVKK